MPKIRNQAEGRRNGEQYKTLPAAYPGGKADEYNATRHGEIFIIDGFHEMGANL